MDCKKTLLIFHVVLLAAFMDIVLGNCTSLRSGSGNHTNVTDESLVQIEPVAQKMVSVPWDTTSEHGTMVFVSLEGGCWLFVSDCGDTVEPRNGPPWMYYHDIEGTMTAVHRHDWGSICDMSGVEDVIWFTPDPFRAHGTMHLVGAEWNCWQFEADDGRLYEPIDGPEGMYVEGVTGTMTAYPRREMGSTCQAGEIVEVLDFESDCEAGQGEYGRLYSRGRCKR